MAYIMKSNHDLDGNTYRLLKNFNIEKKNKHICRHCEKTGHAIEKCNKIQGFL